MSIIRSHSCYVRTHDRPEEHHPRVVDHRVEPAELGDRLLDHLAGLRLDGDVRGQDEGATATGADALGQGVQAIGTAGHEGEGGAVLGEGHGRGLPDPTRGSGDKCDGAAEGDSLMCSCPTMMAGRSAGPVTRRQTRRRSHARTNVRFACRTNGTVVQQPRNLHTQRRCPRERHPRREAGPQSHGAPIRSQPGYRRNDVWAASPDIVRRLHCSRHRCRPYADPPE